MTSEAALRLSLGKLLFVFIARTDGAERISSRRSSRNKNLGSAPVETFETLLDAFISVGAKSVEIGQF